MEKEKGKVLTRREFVAASSAFMILPRHVLGGPGFVPPSDRITLAAIGMGHQGFDVMMELLSRPDVQVVAVCDCNKGSKDYVEYEDNGILKAARRLLGPGYENWGADLAASGAVQLTHTFRTSVGMVAASRPSAW